MAAINTLVDDKIKGKKVMVFSKNGCPYCKIAKDVFKKMNLSTDDIEIWDFERYKNSSEIQKYLLNLTGAKTVPRVFINGKCIGGGSETKSLYGSGKLQKLIDLPN